jgi:hypothetical protein
MKMKIMLIFLYTLMLVVGIRPIEASQNTMNQTTYLVIGKDATIDGIRGQSVHNRFIEHTIIHTGNIGDPLPIPVSTQGHLFRGYAVGFNNELQFYTEVPATNHTILYAIWAPQQDPRLTQPVIDQDISLFKADLYLSTAEGVFDPKYQMSFKSSDNDTSAVNFTEYYITLTVEAGFTFMFRSKNPLIQGVQAKHYPTLASGKSGLGYSLPTGTGKVAPFRSIDYIEVLGQTTVYNQTDFVFPNGVNAGSLRFKQSGTVRIYVVFYDLGGWVKVYVEPV